MNDILTAEIAFHILANLGVLSSNFVNVETTKSLIDKNYLLPEKIIYQQDDQTINKNVFGCQVSITNNKDFKLLLADCTMDKNNPEYGLLVQLKGSPTFGVHLIQDHNYELNDLLSLQAIIAVNSDKKHWIPCSTYLQATFLAGMEQLRDLGSGWKKCDNYKDQYQLLLSFIKFQQQHFGGFDEGEEN